MLRFENVEVRYGDVAVLSCVSAEFDVGRVHALVGENGAGKSSLLRAAAGLVGSSQGHIAIGDERRATWSVRQSLSAGMRMVFQHTALVQTMSVTENVLLAGRRLGSLDLRHAQDRLKARAQELGIAMRFDVPVSQLSVPEQQRAELLRAMAVDCRVLVLDEPTAVLPPAEIHALYTVLRRVAQSGVAVLVVTHKLAEVARYADTVTALRHGAVVGARDVELHDKMQDVLAWVMGRGNAEPALATQRPFQQELAVATLTNVHVAELRGLSLTLRKGEIVGLAGVDGNGQEALSAVLAGELAPAQGAASLCAAVVVHEDRQRDGLVLGASVMDNTLLGGLSRFSRFGLLRLRSLVTAAERVLTALGSDLVPPASEEAGERGRAHQRSVLGMDVAALSGGNQQKIVIARAIDRTEEALAATGACVLVAHFPTRGVDVGASQAIHRTLRRVARERGAAVLVRSADLDELRQLCDRIVVISGGVVTGEFDARASDERLGAAMLSGDAAAEISAAQ